MNHKLLVWTVPIFLGSLGAAGAQAPTPPPKGPTPTTAELDALTGHGAVRSRSASTTAAALGWNFFHIFYCYGFYSGGNFYQMWFSNEGPSWLTLDGNLQHQVDPSCSSGNWVGVNVVDTSGAFNAVRTYSFR